MRQSPLHFDSTRWAAYENQALDSASVGHLQFLAIGPRNTFQEPPERLPDTPQTIGWKYGFVGWVDLESGEITEA
jgi:hypothetical protein